MDEEKVALNTTIDACLTNSRKSPSPIIPLEEPFLNFDVNSELSFYHQSTIYNSLLTLVNSEYPFDDGLEERATQFLKSLEPKWGDFNHAAKLVTDLVPSSVGSPSGFIESILTLLSYPHSNVVAGALSFLFKTILNLHPEIRYDLVKSNLIANVLATVQPHTLPISGNVAMIDNLVRIIDSSLYLAFPKLLEELTITTTVDKFDYRELIFQNVVIPSAQFLTFLISNRHVLSGSLLEPFMLLLCLLLLIGPYHRPTLEFVLASPVVMAFSSCLSFDESDSDIWNTLRSINEWLEEWKEEGAEVFQSGKQVIQALFSEDFESTLEQMMNHQSGDLRTDVTEDCCSISRLLGANGRKSR
ncbi:hypothetical protein BLNAU_6509 [Blattamonas nauphoetae]|uniref:Uncharacterized protein n=1 Tax=Blattamonas nauphoetae TaxID=2049346 RepID=A0ABQ9Y442_9EUKA|nr:hypothetical protein BLNAU_6509 [Blattamonas nauphoetae]